MALGSAGIDPFGLDPAWAKYALATVGLLHRRYFRTDVHGIENVPTGGCSSCSAANHSGQVPLDGAVIGAAMFMDAEPPRIVRAMVEKWAVSLPFVSLLFARVGQVVGVPENAKRLLAQGEALLVFLEGTRDLEDLRPALPAVRVRARVHAARHRDGHAYRPGRGHRRRGAVHLGRQRADARAALADAVPSPSCRSSSFLGGQLPLPTKYRLWFGEPLTFTGDPDDDDAVIEEKVWIVKQTLQSMLNRGLKERAHIFW